MRTSNRSAPAATLALAVCVIASLSAAPAAPQQPPGSTAPPEMERLVRQFYDLRARTLDERGTEQDVSALLDLLAPDASYEHPRARVTMTREQAAAGIKAHLREGRNARITIHGIVLGTDAAAAEVTIQYDVPDTRVTRGVSIFAFASGRIRRVAEY